MIKTICQAVMLLCVTLGTWLVAGCATTGDQRVNVLYQINAHGTGGSGTFYLVGQTPSAPGGGTTVQWVLGEIKDKDGGKLGNTVTDTAPADIVASAYNQELKGAGYNTVQMATMPADAAKGMVLKSAVIRVDEVKGAATLEARCKVKVAVEPWLNGRPASTVSYEAEYTESTLTGREVLAARSVNHALETIMARSVPDIIRTVEQQK